MMNNSFFKKTTSLAGKKKPRDGFGSLNGNSISYITAVTLSARKMIKRSKK